MIQRTIGKLKLQVEKIKGFFKGKDSIRKSDLIMGMVRVIVLCWLVPYLTLSIVLFYFSETKTNRQISDTITTSMENAAEICNISVMSAVSESKEASYDGVIKKSYTEFVAAGDEATETNMYKEISAYLNKRYKYSTVFSSTILLFNQETKQEYYTYSNRAGAIYSNINNFKQNAMKAARKVADGLGTDTRLVYIAGHLYLVRNMVTSDYTPFAVLVMEINVDNMFKSLDNVVWRQDSLIFLDNVLIKKAEHMDETEAEKLREYAKKHVLNDEKLSENEIINVYDKKAATAYLTMNVNGQKISYVVKLDKIGILNESSTIIYIYGIIGVLLIPLLYATFYYFYTNISKPISELMYASEKIEGGNFGYQLTPFRDNEEFGKLIDTFNHMSASLEDSFNRIYAEEVALRDANMQALQAQINPHFLNNTLEIINWKARMSGDKDVSRMVESLGVMMEATMNRRNEHFIAIEEELNYVDAYLYIIVQRFGDKFQFEKEIDERLLDIKIPRLIIQPLVENMVEHGGDMYGNRMGKLKIYGDGRYLYIVVENNGNISKKDALKIEKLLSAGKLEENIHNIGIRNVNLRLKMLYGEASGLTIENEEENLTVSRIKIERTKLLEVVGN